MFLTWTWSAMQMVVPCLGASCTKCTTMLHIAMDHNPLVTYQLACCLNRAYMHIVCWTIATICIFVSFGICFSTCFNLFNIFRTFNVFLGFFQTWLTVQKGVLCPCKGVFSRTKCAPFLVRFSRSWLTVQKGVLCPCNGVFSRTTCTPFVFSRSCLTVQKGVLCRTPCTPFLFVSDLLDRATGRTLAMHVRI